MKVVVHTAICAAALLFAIAVAPARADPVIASHPRLLLTAAEKARLLAKKNANDPSWLALQAQADTLAGYTINPYKFATSGDSPLGTIYYTYQGEGWSSAALPLAFAYQMTGDTKYSNKLIELAQEMIRAQSDPDNAAGLPIQLDSYYASRNVGAVIAFIFDYCYDQLSNELKSQMVALMNAYFDDVAVNGYQAQDYSNAADGNYFGGHLYAVALMGYASFGDNPRAQEMIEWARIRFDGSPAPSIDPSRIPLAWRSQCFDGGLRPAVAFDFNGPAITGNPFKGGFDFQAWSYGSEEFSRMIDYMLVVKSATGEDIVTPHIDWFSQILRAEKHALFPNHFLIDPTGDWGGYQGAVILRELPTRLAYILAGTDDGPGAQHFASSEIAESTIADVQVFPMPEWVEFFFNASRPSTELTLLPFYTGFGPNYPQGAVSPGGTNGAIPYFIMRSDWSDTATWASVVMGSQWWDDHQHYTAGHLVIARGSDYLLVSAGDWKTQLDNNGDPIYGSSGVLGGSLEALRSGVTNTLFFDDRGDFQYLDERQIGGQSAVGIDEVVADEVSQSLTYVRSDLSTAYNRMGDPDDTVNRKLEFFYRNFIYLRPANVFVVYDQVKAKTSDASPEYRKHLRWHLPNAPSITGRTARLDYGQSRLFIDTVMPSTAALAVVNEWTNPDPCDGSDPFCTPIGADGNSGTFRVEVSDPANPLAISFLTVLQPGDATSTAPVDTRIDSIDGKMTGVVIDQAGGVRNIVLFNNQAGQVPPPITSTSYAFTGPGLAAHTLAGLVPNASYIVSFAAGVVSVTQDAGGTRTASPSGVLRFTLAPTGSLPAVPAGISAAAATTTRVDVSWNAVPGATSYEIDRRESGGSGFMHVGNSAGNSFADPTVSGGKAYLYRVRSAGASGTSGDSAAALATTVIFDNDPLSNTVPIRAVHMAKLRLAVNAVRSLADLPPVAFGGVSSGTVIKATDITDLRPALDAALAALGFTAGGYSNAVTTNVPVAALDSQELRDRVR